MSVGELISIAAVIAGYGGLLVKVRQLEAEVEKLRAWHHKVGDNPTATWVQALNIIERRIERLEQKD